MPDAILVVDDDPIQRRLLSATVERLGHRALTAENGEAAVAIMTAEAADIALVILDLVMPELDGMAVLERMRAQGLDLPVIVQTAHGGIDTVVGAMRAGAVDFVVKPAAPERMQVSIENALKLKALQKTVARANHHATGSLQFGDIIAGSDAMERVIRLGRRAAASTIPILIEGESGVGKELIARAIQGSGDRKGRPFVTVNCGAIPDNLVESVLFGHEKGAFTGAVDKHVGKFREAHGGTLFLDEIGELPPDVQVKLLRALQEGEIDPVGANQSVRVDIRIISATNRDLIELTKAGRFREDLYYRLNVFPIRVPPLRERREEIPGLVRHFAARFAAEEGKPHIRGVSATAMALLRSYDWPGNIRQLENAIFRAVVLADGASLTVDEFPQVAAAMDTPAQETDSVTRSATTEQMGESGKVQPEDFAPDYGLSIADGPAVIPIIGPDGAFRRLEDIEAESIRLAIDHHAGRMTQVAKALGIGRSTLYRKLKEFGISDTPHGNAAA